MQRARILAGSKDIRDFILCWLSLIFKLSSVSFFTHVFSLTQYTHSYILIYIQMKTIFYPYFLNSLFKIILYLWKNFFSTKFFLNDPFYPKFSNLPKIRNLNKFYINLTIKNKICFFTKFFQWPILPHYLNLPKIWNF